MSNPERQKPIRTAERFPTAKDANANGEVWAWDVLTQTWHQWRWHSVSACLDTWTHWAPIIEPEKPGDHD